MQKKGGGFGTDLETPPTSAVATCGFAERGGFCTGRSAGCFGVSECGGTSDVSPSENGRSDWRTRWVTAQVSSELSSDPTSGSAASPTHTHSSSQFPSMLPCKISRVSNAT